MIPTSIIQNCRLCGSFQIEDLHYFGLVAAANNYRTKEDLRHPEPKFTLTPVLCAHCGHLQLKETINRDFLFGNYLYASSTSGSLSNYFAAYTKDVIARLALSPDAGYILDCGSNDGVTLQHFKDLGFEVLGVEPATNLASIANERGIPTINDFFGKSVAEGILETYGRPALIISNNTYAHLEQHHDFTAGVELLLNGSNYFVFENAHALPTIQNLYFDQFYHDHLGYFWTKPLHSYFGGLGLKIFHVEKTSNQGGSIRVFVRQGGSGAVDTSVDAVLQEELAFGLGKLETYAAFFSRLADIQVKFKAAIQRSDLTLSCYGCPAKFALFSKVFGLSSENVSYVVDDSPFKQGLYAPESGLEIVSRDHFVQNPTDACIISAWNFEAFIRKSNPQYAGVWLNPFNP